MYLRTRTLPSSSWKPSLPESQPTTAPCAHPAWPAHRWENRLVPVPECQHASLILSALPPPHHHHHYSQPVAVLHLLPFLSVSLLAPISLLLAELAAYSLDTPVR